jgi:hypothetical protein
MLRMMMRMMMRGFGLQKLCKFESPPGGVERQGAPPLPAGETWVAVLCH